MKTDKPIQVLQKAKEFGLRFTDFTSTYDALVKAYIKGHSDADAAVEQLEQKVKELETENVNRKFAIKNLISEKEDLEQKLAAAEAKLAAQEREIDILRLYMSKESKAMADARLEAIKQEIKAKESK